MWHRNENPKENDKMTEEKKGPNLCRQTFLGSMMRSQAAKEEEEELLDRVTLGGEKVANDGDEERGDDLAVGGARWHSSRLQIW